MVYGDIPWEEDADIINARLDDITMKHSYSHNTYRREFEHDKYKDVNDLISLCLKLNDNERISLEEILQHKWFSYNMTTNKSNNISIDDGQSCTSSNRPISTKN